MSNTEDTPKQKISNLGSKSCKVRWSIFTLAAADWLLNSTLSVTSLPYGGSSHKKNLKNSMHMEIEITWTDLMKNMLFFCADSDADEA